MTQYIEYPNAFSGVLPVALGQTTMANSLPVVIASDQSSLPVTPGPSTGRASVLLYRNDYTSVNVTTAAYVQITASTTATINKFYVFDSSGSLLVIATGAAASEVNKFYVVPGGTTAGVELTVASGTRLSIKAIDTNATTGQIAITALS